MIVGKLKDLYRYKGIAKNIDTAIDFILEKGIDGLIKMAPGKYNIDGDNVKLNRDTYIAKDKKDTFFENHENYMDLQVVLSGKEYFAYTDISNPELKVTTPYNAEKDVTKYNGGDVDSVKNSQWFVLEEGYALVYTEDVHLAKCDVDGKTVEKAVFKIKIEK
jgi:YhcH/YjgK/YiaL family protein